MFGRALKRILQNYYEGNHWSYVVKILAYRAKCPGFESWYPILNFRDWVLHRRKSTWSYLMKLIWCGKLTVALIFSNMTLYIHVYGWDIVEWDINKAVGTIWRALSKPPQRRQGPDPRPLWLLVGTPSAFGPELAYRLRVAQPTLMDVARYFWYTLILLYMFVYYIFMTSPLWLAVGPQSI